MAKGVLMCRQDKGLGHKSVAAIATVRECGLELLHHPHILLIWHHLMVLPHQTANKTTSMEFKYVSVSIEFIQRYHRR